MNNHQVNKNKAIKAATDQNWEDAITYNLEILEESPKDIATLNRLGFAYMRVNQVDNAKKTYQKVLDLDKYNPIAKKNLQKLSSLKPGMAIKNNTVRVKTSFIEEPGITKTLNLTRLAPDKTLLSITIGMPVRLTAKKRRVAVETEDKTYLGCIPDDVGLRLEKLLKLDYQYEAHIKAIEDKHLVVFIRETRRSPKAKNIPSFPGNNAVVIETNAAATKNRGDIPIDVTPTGEEDSD
jgi:tetratricopeptide (TPR) repeat protein